MADFIGFAGLLLSILDSLKDYRHKTAIKTELYDIIEGPLKNVADDINDLLDDMYTCIGAIAIGYYVPPLNPERKAEELASKFEDGYKKLEEDMHILIEYVRAHKDSFKQIVDERDWITLESVIYAFETDETNWKFLLTHRSVKDNLINTDNGKKFLSTLNNHLLTVNQNMDIDIFPDSQDIIKVIKEFTTYSSTHGVIKEKRNAIIKNASHNHYRRR